MNRKNLHARVEKAKAAMLFAKVLHYDSDGRVISILLPGTQGKNYHVIIRRRPASVELNLETAMGFVKPYYAHHYITYHAMAAMMVAAREQGYKIQWCASGEDARRLSNIDGIPFRITNHDNPEIKMWGVYL